MSGPERVAELCVEIEVGIQHSEERFPDADQLCVRHEKLRLLLAALQESQERERELDAVIHKELMAAREAPNLIYESEQELTQAILILKAEIETGASGAINQHHWRRKALHWLEEMHRKDEALQTALNHVPPWVRQLPVVSAALAGAPTPVTTEGNESE